MSCLKVCCSYPSVCRYCDSLHSVYLHVCVYVSMFVVYVYVNVVNVSGAISPCITNPCNCVESDDRIWKPSQLDEDK